MLENYLPHRGLLELIHGADADSSASSGGRSLEQFLEGVARGGADLLGADPLKLAGRAAGSGKAGKAGRRRKQLLWCSELDFGESVAIHSVGLESELKLLLNLG